VILIANARQPQAQEILHQKTDFFPFTGHIPSVMLKYGALTHEVFRLTLRIFDL
jgi:hypothetical protein